MSAICQWCSWMQLYAERLHQRTAAVQLVGCAAPSCTEPLWAAAADVSCDSAVPHTLSPALHPRPSSSPEPAATAWHAVLVLQPPHQQGPWAWGPLTRPHPAAGHRRPGYLLLLLLLRPQLLLPCQLTADSKRGAWKGVEEVQPEQSSATAGLPCMEHLTRSACRKDCGTARHALAPIVSRQMRLSVLLLCCCCLC